MASKPSIPKGTRDFSPAEVSKRQYIIQIIKSNFEKFGFQPIETPSFENSDTLMGKYGEEGDRLIFKILNSGDFFEKKLENDFFDLNSISIYVSIQKIFRDVTSYIFHYKIKGQSFLTFEDFEKLLVDKEVLAMIEYKIEEWTSRNVFKDRDFGIAFDKELTERKSYLLAEIVDFIRMTGLDFEQVRNEDFLQKSLFIADYNVIKKISNEFCNVLGQKKSISSFMTSYISEKALRYDLTVPFARYVVQNQSEIVFPFKRYQIQPVWRADKPQKGRFREFYQCDADVVGSKSLWQEVELVQLYDTVFTSLGLEGVTIKINNRKILSGIAEVIGASDKLIDFTVALDKLDKIGEDGVKKEMIEKGIPEEALVKVQPLFNFTGTFADKILQLSSLLAESEEGMKGVEELKFICDNVATLGLSTATLDLDVTLARGLNYYTGAIFEVAAPKTVSMGSIGGGGRYDDLTGIFGLKNMSGVGISFGLDRIYLVLEELQLFPETVAATSKALFINYGDAEALYASQAIQKLRKENIKVELYPDNVKVGKQFQYADKRLIPFAVIAGDQEIASNSYSLKNLVSGEQISVDFEGLKNALLA
ncbi:histidyl-tRNA synthetase [Flavobacterium araucananum]|uniref:Histidine--tRNA ligase n=2 Tax=Flavobacterium araucananum TaxID=946678 RepID=A0A227PEG2_9FLAO|nr:histidine--tRNA ligase [Flavobacterium araucananum]OXG08267.1 histidine--tRNA ligase [Flavobacterium araucananum]PWJ99211.1 histidyl-tRNA synthetase [Flavobacterium araucananum]